MKLGTLAQLSRNAARFKEIVSILVKYGLANWVKEHEPQFIQNLLKRSQGDPIADLSPEVRLRLALTELGTTFIKLGQILSTRSDMISPAMADELSKLQADVPPDDPNVVRQTIEAELGKTLEELFHRFEPGPLGSASIGQVHQATLKDGTEVVVKVQHAGIEETIVNDLDILKSLAEMAERYDPDLQLYQPSATVAEFSRNLLRELDFLRELRNLNQFRQNFIDSDSIYIPQPFSEFSSRRVLTMERLSGFSVAEADKLDEHSVDRSDFVEKGANIYLDMIFRDRFFHADPHPGNIWVVGDSRVGLLDCGMTGRLDKEMSGELEGMLLAAIDGDADRLTDHVMRISTSPLTVKRSILRRDIDDYLSEYIHISMEHLNVSSALNSLTDILREHRIVLPSGISLLIRVLVMLEGTSRLIDRRFNLVELLEPHVKRSALKKYSPKKLLSQAQRNYRDWDQVLKILPRDLHEILIKIREGRFDVHIEHRRLEKVVEWLVQGILSAALFMGGSQILSRQIPPLIGGLSVIGLITTVLGLILGYRLIVTMHKSRGQL